MVHSRFVASASYDKTVRLWDARTGASRGALEGHSDWTRVVAFSLDGQLLASASEDSTVRLWSTKTGEAIQTLYTEEYIHNLCFSSASPYLETNRRLIKPETLSSCLSRSSSNPLCHLYVKEHRVASKTDNVLRLLKYLRLYRCYHSIQICGI